MQILLKWINELVNIERVQLDDLIEKLTLGGFEVEEILEVEIENQKQTVLNISATANRSDSLSIQGISKEISALLNQPTINPNYSIEIVDWKETIESFSKPISPDSNCSIFSALIIENVPNISVPNWIRQKLISSDIVPLNNLLDFQNYILLETGYPFVFYDFDKIISKLNTSNFELSISTVNDNQKFLASNEVEYQLDNSILTINANEFPISIAGIIEANDFSYTDSTNSILVEGSIFNAAKIRQQSRKLGLRTDRSARYEKSLKPINLLESLYRLILLLRISNPDLTCRLHTISQNREENLAPILLRYETINEILGPTNDSTEKNFSYLTPNKITDYLTRLGFNFNYNKSTLNWKVEIPKSRTEDITREIDLIEEIGRLHGFNNFLTTLPKIKTIGIEDSTYQTRKKITASLLNLGFNELIHYSLVSQTTFLNNEVKLINPLLSDCSNLRASLLPSLVKTVQENLKQKNITLEGFEYGHVFSQDSKMNFKEKEYVAGIFGGKKTKLSWSDSEISLTWFEAKGKIEQLFRQLNLLSYWKRAKSTITANIFHPHRSAELFLIDKTKIGIFGQIHPILANQLNLSSEIYLFEFNIEVIEHQLQLNKLTLYKEYSLYPKIVKDLSFIIRNDIPFKKVHETLYYNGTEFLSEIHLLDEYRGQAIPKDHTSLCLQLIFQSSKKTLENKEIENIINKLQLVLSQKFNASIRK
jgi:phenylalanyl-tRNA synthetase beta chain